MPNKDALTVLGGALRSRRRIRFAPPHFELLRDHPPARFVELPLQVAYDCGDRGQLRSGLGARHIGAHRNGRCRSDLRKICTRRTSRFWQKDRSAVTGPAICGSSMPHSLGQSNTAAYRCRDQKHEKDRHHRLLPSPETKNMLYILVRQIYNHF